jgi:hypothetical protein
MDLTAYLPDAAQAVCGTSSSGQLQLARTRGRRCQAAELLLLVDQLVDSRGCDDEARGQAAEHRLYIDLVTAELRLARTRRRRCPAAERRLLVDRRGDSRGCGQCGVSSPWRKPYGQTDGTAWRERATGDKASASSPMRAYSWLGNVISRDRGCTSASVRRAPPPWGREKAQPIRLDLTAWGLFTCVAPGKCCASTTTRPKSGP